MFTHQGKRRTFTHNLQIATLLSFVAGLVNVAGFLAVKQLTTNVTGHFAFFIDAFFQIKFWNALIYFLYIGSFFMGSFFSGLLVEYINRRNADYSYIIPTAIEAILLFVIAVLSPEFVISMPNLLAFALLFTMGLQNALVTKISDATVRTTHLTGLFTDMGIELSQLFFYKDVVHKSKLLTSIRLRLAIIFSFFVGGTTAGIFYGALGLRVLFIGVAALIFGLVYDYVKLSALLIRRKLRRHV